jgi:hypothetical protein
LNKYLAVSEAVSLLYFLLILAVKIAFLASYAAQLLD